MNYDIDCLIIGNNETNFSEYVNQVEFMGIDSGAYQDLNPNFIRYNDKPYNAKQIYNMFLDGKDINLSEVFSATISYLGTFLSKHGLTFDYVNTFQESKDILKEKLINKKIRTIAITTTLYVSVFPIIEIYDFIKKYNTEAKIIIGGPFVTTQYKVLDKESLVYLLKNINADFYINSSQGELALVNTIKAIRDKTNYDDIDNIFYKNGNDYVFTKEVTENNRLSENMVNWDIFKNNIGRYANLRTSISCPFSCSFCAFPEHAGKYQVASVKDIEKELDQIDRIGTVKSIFFVDDTLNVPNERFKELLKLMIKKKYKFKWYSHYRCQFADEETISLMKQSGCEGVFLGIESGNQGILNNMNKLAKIEDFKKGIALLNKYGIITQASFIIGFPGETKETVEDTMNFIIENNIDFYKAQIWYCDTTTRIFKEGKEKFGIKGSQFEWQHNTMDSKTAVKYLKEMTLKINNRTRIPNYFDIDAVIRLKHSNVGLNKIHEFLNIFNECIKDKYIYEEMGNISEERVNQFIRCINNIEDDNIQNNFENDELLDVNFDF